MAVRRGFTANTAFTRTDPALNEGRTLHERLGLESSAGISERWQ